MGRKNHKPPHKMPRKGRKKQRNINSQSFQIKELPSYNDIVKYFFNYGEIKHYKLSTHAYLESSDYIIKSKHSIPSSSIVYRVFDKYQKVVPEQVKFSVRHSSYYVDTLILNKLKNKGSYYEFVGFAYFNNHEWSLKHRKNNIFVPGLVKTEKSFKSLEETLGFVKQKIQ